MSTQVALHDIDLSARIYGSIMKERIGKSERLSPKTPKFKINQLNQKSLKLSWKLHTARFNGLKFIYHFPISN